MGLLCGSATCKIALDFFCFCLVLSFVGFVLIYLLFGMCFVCLIILFCLVRLFWFCFHVSFVAGPGCWALQTAKVGGLGSCYGVYFRYTVHHLTGWWFQIFAKTIYVSVGNTLYI